MVRQGAEGEAGWVRPSERPGSSGRAEHLLDKNRPPPSRAPSERSGRSGSDGCPSRTWRDRRQAPGSPGPPATGGSSRPPRRPAGRNRRTGRGRIAIILVSSLAIRPTASPGCERPRTGPHRPCTPGFARRHRPGFLGTSRPDLDRRRGGLASLGAGDWLARRRRLASLGAADWLRSAPRIGFARRRRIGFARRRVGWVPCGRGLVRSGERHPGRPPHPNPPPPGGRGPEPGPPAPAIGFARRRRLARSEPGIGFARRRGLGPGSPGEAGRPRPRNREGHPGRTRRTPPGGAAELGIRSGGRSGISRRDGGSRWPSGSPSSP